MLTSQPTQNLLPYEWLPVYCLRPGDIDTIPIKLNKIQLKYKLQRSREREREREGEIERERERESQRNKERRGERKVAERGR